MLDPFGFSHHQLEPFGARGPLPSQGIHNIAVFNSSSPDLNNVDQSTQKTFKSTSAFFTNVSDNIASDDEFAKAIEEAGAMESPPAEAPALFTNVSNDINSDDEFAKALEEAAATESPAELGNSAVADSKPFITISPDTNGAKKTAHVFNEIIQGSENKASKESTTAKSQINGLIIDNHDAQQIMQSNGSSRKLANKEGESTSVESKSDSKMHKVGTSFAGASPVSKTVFNRVIAGVRNGNTKVAVPVKRGGKNIGKFVDINQADKEKFLRDNPDLVLVMDGKVFGGAGQSIDAFECDSNADQSIRDLVETLNNKPFEYGSLSEKQMKLLNKFLIKILNERIKSQTNEEMSSIVTKKQEQIYRPKDEVIENEQNSNQEPTRLGTGRLSSLSLEITEKYNQELFNMKFRKEEKDRFLESVENFFAKIEEEKKLLTEIALKETYEKIDKEKESLNNGEG